MKQYTHLLAPLVLWVIGLALYIVTITNDIPKRVDSIRTYRMHKHPVDFPNAMYDVKNAFLANWVTDDCYILTSFGSNPTCKAQRAALKTAITTAVECDIYNSEMCNCIAQVTNGIADSTGNAGKNLGGWKDATVYAIESCRWLMHNAHTAVYYGKPWAQKTAILLLILTLATANGFDWVVMNYWLQGEGWDETSKSLLKTGAFLLWGFLTMIISVTLDNSTYMIFILILIPPIVLLFLYEMYKGAYNFTDRPFIHPYVFCCILGALTFLAHAEMGIVDYDVLVYEVFKCNVVSYIYLQVVWKYMIKDTKEDYSKSRFVEQGTLRGVILAFLMYITGVLAPYPVSCNTVAMWYTPLLWVVLAFASVAWVTSFNYDEYFGDRSEKKGQKHWKLNSASRYVSGIMLIFLLLIVLYYLRENSTVFRALIDNYPTNTMQYNLTNTWQRPPTFATK